MSLYEKKRKEDHEEDAHNRFNARARACMWLILAVVVFFCSVVTCIVLIINSADVDAGADAQQVHIEDIKYVANNTEGEDVPNESVPEQPKLTAPESVYDSTRLNILLSAYDEESEQTDAMIIICVDTSKAQPAMISIPRDTYISGDYEIPKINRVYAANGSRGIDAMKEAVENMIGFRLDKYLVFDSKALQKVIDITGNINFEIPEEPMYHTLSAGKQTLDGKNAFELFRYNDEYTDVETEPYFVQRDFLAEILDALLKDQENKLDNAEAICDAVQTDLLPTELAYLTDLLKNARFAAAFSRALPGGVIEIRGESYYQVEPVEACELLNGHFNPLDSDLTEYDVHFRQLQGSSGEGELADWGFGGVHPTTNPDLTEAPSEPTEENTEENTENETSEPVESSEEQTPDEPTEPDGDE